MSRVTNIPLAPKVFNQQEEQLFRDKMRRDIEGSVARSSLFNPTTGKPLFFGQPHAQLRGTDNALSVVTATLTYCPLPTVELTHPNLVDSGEIKVKYPMDIEVTAQIYHPSPGGAARKALYTLYISAWDGATYVADYIQAATTMDFADAWSLNFSTMVHLTGLYNLRLRILHNDVANNIFDLTNSYMNVKQLETDPMAIASVRL